MTKRQFVEKVNERMGCEALSVETEGPLCRAEAAEMLAEVKCLGQQPEAVGCFADAEKIPEEWKGAVGAVSVYGYLRADENGNFRPLAELGEDEAEEMLRRANPGRRGPRAYTKVLKRPAGRLDVEQLWFQAGDPAVFDRWAQLDDRHWTRFLMSWDAVGRKDYWLSRKKPGELSTVIYGRDKIWKSIGQARCQQVDSGFIAELGKEHYNFLRGEVEYQVVAYVADGQYKESAEIAAAKLLRPMAVEELKFRLKTPELLETWLEADHSIWTQSLAQNEGFYRKDIWQSTSDPCVIKVVIYWRSQEDWLAYDHRLLAPLDAKMEAALGEGNCVFVAGEHEDNEYYLGYQAE